MSDDDDIPQIHPVSWERTGLSMDDLPAAIKTARQEIHDIEAVLFPAED